MRFAIALVTLLIAGALVAAGVAQRTVLKPEDHVTAVADVPSDVHYVVVPGSVLRSHQGQQNLHLGGSDAVFAGYGRSSDVTAWLSGQRYAELRTDASGAMTKPVVRTAPVIGQLEGGTPDPSGADLWIDQKTGERSLDWSVDVPKSMSVIIASTGADAAPSDVRLTWPVRTATPFAVPLIVAGGALAVLGLLLYLWALVHVRRQRGPRRKSPPKMPKRPQPPKYRPQRPASAAPVPGRGRRSVRQRVAVVGSGAAAVLLAGLLAPTSGAAVAATPTPTASLTEEQATRILFAAADTAAAADKAGSAKQLGDRFTGAALDLRKAFYTIEKKDSKAAAPATIPTRAKGAVVKLLEPEATTSWPRTLFATVQQGESTKVAPVSVALVQNDPRSNYKVQFAMRLISNAKTPDLPSAVDGAHRLDPSAPVLTVEPGQLATAYGAVLNDSGASTAKLFRTQGDPLLQEVGESAKKKIAKKLGSTAGITFKDLPVDPNSVIAMSTADPGALVAVQLDEQWTVKPKRSGVTVKPSGGTKILSKTSSTSKGIVSVYGYQLLFSVPSAGSEEPIVLLGYDQGLVSAKEL
ncbi:hypothetical protein [Amnibacterium kyonggiense]|uniref:DUF8094 domain-containing protein n=1 Tax=Amnibacterium kyonggiense TaxID=595671 RepID=A0A4R7FSX3_9MICO|nr:hypothetical protein [Amnibacterium kyonggiense]TDS80982.1 hypothetical protein CLV52_1554 [Amnibacterium kyonggiense]